MELYHSFQIVIPHRIVFFPAEICTSRDKIEGKWLVDLAVRSTSGYAVDASNVRKSISDPGTLEHYDPRTLGL